MRIGIILLLFYALFFSPSSAWAEPHIEALEIDIANAEIFVSYKLARGFSRETKRDIHDGIEKTFYHYIVLTLKHEEWFDEEITSQTLLHTVKYDTIKKVYTVRRQNGQEIQEQVTDHWNEMEAWVANVEKIYLAPISLLKPDRRYFARVKAQMRVSHVPLYLDRFLFFIPFLELNTPWKQSRSIYSTEGH